MSYLKLNPSIPLTQTCAHAEPSWVKELLDKSWPHQGPYPICFNSSITRFTTPNKIGPLQNSITPLVTLFITKHINQMLYDQIIQLLKWIIIILLQILYSSCNQFAKNKLSLFSNKVRRLTLCWLSDYNYQPNIQISWF